MVRKPRRNETSKRLPNRLASKLIEPTFKRSPMLLINGRSCPERQEAPINKGIHRLSQSLLFDQRLECRNRREKSGTVAGLER